MLDVLLRVWVKCVLWFRYRVRLRGADEIAARGTRGILFLPNHPALIDPIIVGAYLHRPFRPRPLADQDQVDRFFIRWAAKRVRVLPIPDMRKHGVGVRDEIRQVVERCAAALRQGDNLMLYPSGHLYRSRNEDLRGNSAVESLLKLVPDARIVLVRTRGLWGSSFSLHGGQMPNVRRILWRRTFDLLANLAFFTPRRAITIELHEPEDLPRTASRNELNDFLQAHYNEDAPPATYVPYTRWERGGVREMPDPDYGRISGTAANVPESTRRLVGEYLCQACGGGEIRDDQLLERDLGLDSLAKAELVLWLAREFGLTGVDVDALHTVEDVMLAARGESVFARPVDLKPVPAAWFGGRSRTRAEVPAGGSIAEVFLAQARRDPRRLVVADQMRGALTYRDLITAVFALRMKIAALPGQHVGIMLPASAGAVVVYLAALFAGKIPVMVNWTTGSRNVAHALELVGVQRVLTSALLLKRLASQGTDLGALGNYFLPLEDLGRRISVFAKLGAALRARLSWRALDRVPIPDTAVVLLTSGSESLPKAVPLTHTNLLANIRDVMKVARINEDDCLIGFLPPFHSFGLSVTMLVPLLIGARCVYHTNPTEAWLLGRLVESYRVTLLCGTPTFLSGILRASGAGQLDTLRMAITGAEKCPERTYAALAGRCPSAVILEGYGVTECSPIISVNREEDSQHGTIGKVMPSLEHAVVDVDSGQPVERGAVGILLVRGPSVFSGYLGAGVESPFIEHGGKQWYRTGDLVSEDENGVLTFRGRLKRFIKLGGEMISLPAIESVLASHFASENDEGPVLAVEATPSESHPEIVLFTTRDLDRQTANAHIREAGLSALHNIARVEQVDEIPVLGTGKTDYRTLKRRL